MSWAPRFILGFHSRDQQPCFSMKTREDVSIIIAFNSRRIGSWHQHGRHFIVWGHQHGGRDVMWNPRIYISLQLLAVSCAWISESDLINSCNVILIRKRQNSLNIASFLESFPFRPFVLSKCRRSLWGSFLILPFQSPVLAKEFYMQV